MPKNDSGWSQKIALDLDIASAICPKCKLLLVEARSDSFTNLNTAVDTSAKLGANVISLSWCAGEFSGKASYESHDNHPSVAITVSSGDAGYDGPTGNGTPSGTGGF
jgi:subtilase family serine protease